MSDRRTLRIGIAVHSFPTLSETFVLEPIVELLRRGHDVRVLALYPGRFDRVHESVARHGLLQRTRFLIDDRPGGGPLRKAIKGGKRALGPEGRSLAWFRMAADLREAGLLRLVPEIGLSALGTLSAAPDPPFRFDVLHAHGGRIGLVAHFLRRWGLVRGTLVATFHGSDALVDPRRYSEEMYLPLFATAELLTANTDFLVRTLIGLGAPPDRCRRLPVGVDTSEITFRPREWDRSEPFRILTVARLVEFKGVRYGIEAVKLLRQRGLDVRYTIVGDGPRRRSLERISHRNHLESVVTFAGALSWDRVREAYDNSDLFLLPGIVASDGSRESQGKVLLEAQAAGLPWVAPDVGGVSEAVAPGTGKLVRAGDSKAIAHAVEELLGESERWQEMARRGRRHVERHFENRRLVDELLSLYQDLDRSSR